MCGRRLQRLLTPWGLWPPMGQFVVQPTHAETQIHPPLPLPVCHFPCVPSSHLPSRYLNSAVGFCISSPHHFFSTVTSFSQGMGFTFGWRLPGKGLNKITCVGLSRQSPASPQPLHPIGVLAMWEGPEGPCRWTVGDRCELRPFVGLSACLK